MGSTDARRPGDESLDELLRRAAEAPAGLTSGSPPRIEFRDPIAAFGAAAVRRLEEWVADPRLARFATITIEQAAAEPEAKELAAMVLRRARASSPDSVRSLIDQALTRLQPARAVARSRRTSSSAQDAAGSPELAIAELGRLVSEWRKAGSAPQRGIDWPRPAWITKLPKHRDLLKNLPDCIDRAAVRAISVDAADGAEAAERALVAVMVWGHGRRNSRWRFRMPQILATPHASDRLLSVARTLRSHGPLKAYGRLADRRDCRLNGLGPAFATKYLYFCQPENQLPRALIHDSNVSKWLLKYAGPGLSSQNYSERTYDAYLGQMHDWARALACAPDEVELCIFRAGISSTSQWADGCA